MGLSKTLARAAAAADVPVFVARGHGTGAADAVLRAALRLRVVDSPRHATVLLVAGHVPSALAEPLARVHDQLARPRATVWWTGGPPGEVLASWPAATTVGAGGDVVAAVVDAHRDLLGGTRSSDPPQLADVEPAEWRGVGPYGQGGSAMTGGVPYGRPMAGRADDRDGLSLDVVPVTVGPFFPAFPPGLALKVAFAGDVVHDAEVTSWRRTGGAGTGAPLPDDALDPFLAAATGRRVAVAELELARARHHLRWLARLLHLYGLDAFARRALALADRVAPGAAGEVVALARRVERPWVLGRVTAGVGAITGDDAAAWGGPVARAAGMPHDVRTSSPAYAGLGFDPVRFAAGDARDRLRQRLAEAAQALDLAARAAGRVVEAGEPLEWPAPAVGDDLATALATVLAGLEWGDAVAAVASLDLDLDLDLAVDTPVPTAAPLP